MKKIILVAALFIGSTASADMMLNGIGYDANQLCFDGTFIEAQVTKSRDLIRQRGNSNVVVGSVTVNAGDRFNWRKATSYRDNGQGDSVAVNFTREGTPVVIDTVTRGGGDNEETTVIRTAIPSC